MWSKHKFKTTQNTCSERVSEWASKQWNLKCIRLYRDNIPFHLTGSKWNSSWNWARILRSCVSKPNADKIFLTKIYRLKSNQLSLGTQLDASNSDSKITTHILFFSSLNLKSKQQRKWRRARITLKMQIEAVFCTNQAYV